MSKQDDKLHEKIVAGLSDMRVSPAVLALQMARTNNRFVHESLLSYLINYVNIMAHKNLVPIQLADVQKVCRDIHQALAELGYASESYGNPGQIDTNEYVQV